MIRDVFLEDLDQITSSTAIPWAALDKATVLVTGASGLVGTALLNALAAANGRHGLGMRLLAHGRNAGKGAALAEKCGATFFSGDIRAPLAAIEAGTDTIDHIFHCAAVTQSADMVARPVDVITTAVDGTRNVLELARRRQSQSVVYLSSMEVYGQTPPGEVTETDLGYLDLADPRSSYPESKRLCECLCQGYWAQYGVPVKTARLAQTFGAGTPKTDARVFAQFARSALAGEDLVLHTAGNSVGNYCYISDTVTGLLLLLLKGQSGQTYNIANTQASMTIRDMAELVASQVCGGQVRVVVDIPKDIAQRGYAPQTGFTLNADRLKALGWAPRHTLADMYRRLLAHWRLV